MGEIMARSVNKVILIGNVGRDPDDHVTADGKKVAHFSLATNRRVGGESVERTDWHRITVLEQACPVRRGLRPQGRSRVCRGPP